MRWEGRSARRRSFPHVKQSSRNLSVLGCKSHQSSAWKCSPALLAMRLCSVATEVSHFGCGFPVVSMGRRRAAGSSANFEASLCRPTLLYRDMYDDLTRCAPSPHCDPGPRYRLMDDRLAAVERQMLDLVQELRAAPPGVVLAAAAVAAAPTSAPSTPAAFSGSGSAVAPAAKAAVSGQVPAVGGPRSGPPAAADGEGEVKVPGPPTAGAAAVPAAMGGAPSATAAAPLKGQQAAAGGWVEVEGRGCQART
jgi:hypothetical protein